MDPSHNLAASLNPVETRQIHNTNYTFRIDGAVYRIKRQGTVTELRGATVRIEKRLDGKWRCAKKSQANLEVTGTRTST